MRDIICGHCGADMQLDGRELMTPCDCWSGGINPTGMAAGERPPGRPPRRGGTAAGANRRDLPRREGQ